MDRIVQTVCRSFVNCSDCALEFLDWLPDGIPRVYCPFDGRQSEYFLSLSPGEEPKDKCEYNAAIKCSAAGISLPVGPVHRSSAPGRGNALTSQAIKTAT